MMTTKGTSTESFTPASITMTQALVRVGEIRDYIAEEDVEAAQIERVRLYLDILYSIAHAPNFSDKREMRRLANIGLEAFEIELL